MAVVGKLACWYGRQLPFIEQFESLPSILLSRSRPVALTFAEQAFSSYILFLCPTHSPLPLVRFFQHHPF